MLQHRDSNSEVILYDLVKIQERESFIMEIQGQLIYSHRRFATACDFIFYTS